MNGKIYKITNTITGESYIGQTVNSLEERFRHHKQGTRQPKYKMTKLQRAMEEYGKRNFTIELIEDRVETIDELCKKEKYYIKLYGTQNEYNSTRGGETRLKSPKSGKEYFNKNLVIPNGLNLYELDIFMFIVIDICKDISLNEVGLNELKNKLQYFYPAEINRIVESLFSKTKGLFLYLNFDFEKLLIKYKLNDLLFIEKNEKIPFDFKEFAQLDSVYSKRLYLLLKELKKSKKVKLDLNELEYKLDIPLSYRGKPYIINDKVLKPAVKSLVNFFDNLEVKKIKTGRKITHYEFTFTPQENVRQWDPSLSIKNKKNYSHNKRKDITPENKSVDELQDELQRMWEEQGLER